jgi:futalosine hydrolase
LNLSEKGTPPKKKGLIVVATDMEQEKLGLSDLVSNGAVEVLCTGIGLLSTAVNLAHWLSADTHPDWILNLGICGVYPETQIERGIEVGQVIQIGREVLADLGVQNADSSFSSFMSLGFSVEQEWEGAPGCLGKERTIYSSASVQRACGTKELARERSSMAGGLQVENMEGAAVFAIAQKWNIPCWQLRAVSNVASVRDKNLWNIDGALASLKREIYETINFDTGHLALS